MEGKPTIPGLGGEFQPDRGESLVLPSSESARLDQPNKEADPSAPQPSSGGELPSPATQPAAESTVAKVEPSAIGFEAVITSAGADSPLYDQEVAIEEHFNQQSEAA